MSISNLVYKKYCNTKGIERRFWAVSRKFLIKLLRDPPCKLDIHGKGLHLPLSHELPAYLADHKFYDRLPGRLSEYVYEKYRTIKCVDVGANIGDSVAAFYKHKDDKFLAIEATPKFYKYLLANW